MTLNRDGFGMHTRHDTIRTAVRLVTGEKCSSARLYCRQTGKY